eukprot:TRINITY_DN2552_c0_g1_i1.p1 TRINITY_DN2552_c0_g1~~TRINITY_DN2552_c0_g1_i1.p1  ORF type:complete len:113 (+),score=14.79 TRINITY_DN2552_c0_g1_i1:87-425(+)
MATPVGPDCPPQTIPEYLEAARALKDQGNEAFKAKDYNQARICYNRVRLLSLSLSLSLSLFLLLTPLSPPLYTPDVCLPQGIGYCSGSRQYTGNTISRSPRRSGRTESQRTL